MFRAFLISLLVALTFGQTYRSYRSARSFGGGSDAFLRFSDASPMRDYQYSQYSRLRSGTNSPLYVFDGRLYNLASKRVSK